MMQTYEKDMTVSVSHTDFTGELGILDLFPLMLDIATEHAEILGIGSALLKKGVFWLTARSSARLTGRAKLGDQLHMATRIVNVRGSHSMRAYRLTRGDEVIAQCDTTFVAVDIPTGRPVDIMEVCPDLRPEEEGDAPAHANIRFDAQSARALGSYTVRSVDIDLGGHVNNAVYPQILLGFYTVEELRELSVRSFEIAYRSPALEGETLSALECAGDDGRTLALLRGVEPVALARIAN